MTQTDMFDKFDGKTYKPRKDGKRLTTLMGKVYALMNDGKWRTLAKISQQCGGTEASVSARLRDLRKDKFQSKYPNNGVERKRHPQSDGLFVYRMKPAKRGEQ